MIKKILSNSYMSSNPIHEETPRLRSQYDIHIYTLDDDFDDDNLDIY
jgi:hypothetical protein